MLWAYGPCCQGAALLLDSGSGQGQRRDRGLCVAILVHKIVNSQPHICPPCPDPLISLYRCFKVSILEETSAATLPPPPQPSLATAPPRDTHCGSHHQASHPRTGCSPLLTDAALPRPPQACRWPNAMPTCVLTPVRHSCPSGDSGLLLWSPTLPHGQLQGSSPHSHSRSFTDHAALATTSRSLGMFLHGDRLSVHAGEGKYQEDGALGTMPAHHGHPVNTH